jgi:hypothetical protein
VVSDTWEDPADELDRKIAAEFADVQSEYYPGSRHKRRPAGVAPTQVVAADVPDWDDKPRVVTMGGKTVEFFTIGQLALALNRRPVTIRSWEAKGAIPLARYRTPAIGGKEGRRLYTRRQVEGLVDICRRHGLLHFNVRPKAESLSKAFTDEVKALFKEPL